MSPRRSWLPTELSTQLDQIRIQLELAATAAEQAASDLEDQNADIDLDVAHVLRTAVVGVLRKQVEALETLLAKTLLTQGGAE